MLILNRVLGLDVGKKRIGIAISDPLLITAQPLKAISRMPENKAIQEIKDICSKYYVETIIIGLPKNMNGTIGEQAIDCQEFAEKIQQEFDINVIFEDERLTSKQAEFTLREQGKKYTKDKKLVDIVSSQIILQQYLDR